MKTAFAKAKPAPAILDLATVPAPTAPIGACVARWTSPASSFVTVRVFKKWVGETAVYDIFQNVDKAAPEHVSSHLTMSEATEERPKIVHPAPAASGHKVGSSNKQKGGK
jgi:hypothetical protein